MASLEAPAIPRILPLCLNFMPFPKYTQRKAHKSQVYSDEFFQTVSRTTVTSTRSTNDITGSQKPVHALLVTLPHTGNHYPTLCLFFPHKWLHPGG